MSDKAFVDTNVLIYAHSSADAAKHQKASEVLDHLWTTRQGVLSTQVLQEFAFVLGSKVVPALAASDVSARVKRYLSWKIVTNNAVSILNALSIKEQYQVSFWDALILQAAEDAGAEILYSEDFSDGRQYGSVRAVNPLK